MSEGRLRSKQRKQRPGRQTSQPTRLWKTPVAFVCPDCRQKKAERLLILYPKNLDCPVPDCASSYSGFRWNKYTLHKHVTEIHGPQDKYCEVPGCLDTGRFTPVRLYQHQRRTYDVVIHTCNRWLYMDNRSEPGPC